MKLVDALGRRSRSVDKAPSGKTIVITAYDRAILDLLRRYRYLPSTWIIKLLQLDPQWAKRRLSQLRHDALLIECAKGTWTVRHYRTCPPYSTRYRKAKARKGLTGSFGDRSWLRKAII